MCYPNSLEFFSKHHQIVRRKKCDIIKNITKGCVDNFKPSPKRIFITKDTKTPHCTYVAILLSHILDPSKFLK